MIFFAAMIQTDDWNRRCFQEKRSCRPWCLKMINVKLPDLSSPLKISSWCFYHRTDERAQQVTQQDSAINCEVSTAAHRTVGASQLVAVCFFNQCFLRSMMSWWWFSVHQNPNTSIVARSTKAEASSCSCLLLLLHQRRVPVCVEDDCALTVQLVWRC